MRRAPPLLLAILLGCPAGDDATDDGADTQATAPTADDGVPATSTGNDTIADGMDGGGAPYGSCSLDTDCRDDEICRTDPFPDEGAGLNWCAATCELGGDASECLPPHPNTTANVVCADRGDGTGVCTLDCNGGFACPPDMSCFNGTTCVWGE